MRRKAKATTVELRNRIVELRYVKSGDLAENPRNWREHPAAQAQALAGVLGEVGIADALIAYQSARTGKLTLIDGHLRAGSTQATWPVLILDVDDAEADYLLATLDPLTGMATAAKDAYAALLETVQSGEAAVQAMLAEQAQAAGLYLDAQKADDPGAQVDKAEELREKWGVAAGQMWRLGEHRLICGDCTDAATAARVLDSEKVNVVFTSPPYAEQRKNEYGGVEEDKYVAWFEAVQSVIRDTLVQDGSFFVNIKPHCVNGERSLYVFDLVLAMRRNWNWCYIDEFCWLNSAVPGSWPNRFKDGFEPVYHFAIGRIKFRPDNVKIDSDNVFVGSGGMRGRGTGHGYISTGEMHSGTALPSNVVSVSGGDHNGYNHPASFPVGLPRFFILAFSDLSDVIFDPFSGSGTTLIACERLGRRCRAVEIAPGYVAVALERWAAMTGQTPELIA